MLDIQNIMSKFVGNDKNSIAVLKTVGTGVMMGSLGIIFVHHYALQFTNKGLIFSSAALVAFASIGAGGLVGFLFAIPKSLDNSDDEMIDSSDAEKKLNLKIQKRTKLFVGNTNLEQISDWLTKILVGAGLTQIPALLRNIKKLVFFIAPALNGQLKSSSNEISIQVSQSVTLAILVYFSSCGFLWTYLWARLDLPRKLTDANE